MSLIIFTILNDKQWIIKTNAYYIILKKWNSPFVWMIVLHVRERNKNESSYTSGKIKNKDILLFFLEFCNLRSYLSRKVWFYNCIMLFVETILRLFFHNDSVVEHFFNIAWDRVVRMLKPELFHSVWFHLYPTSHYNCNIDNL